jgi:hypothetical protein
MSNFPAFDIPIDDDDGALGFAGVLTVKIWDVTNGADLGTVTSNAQGHVAAGTLAVATGTRVRFRIEHDGQGRAGFNEIVTT